MGRIEKEQSKIREWVENADNLQYARIDKSLDSYFDMTEVDELTTIYEYHFQNIIELEDLIRSRKKVIHNALIDRVCAIAAFKERDNVRNVSQDVATEDKEWKLPEFIYNM